MCIRDSGIGVQCPHSVGEPCEFPQGAIGQKRRSKTRSYDARPRSPAEFLSEQQSASDDTDDAGATNDAGAHPRVCGSTGRKLGQHAISLVASHGAC